MSVKPADTLEMTDPVTTDRRPRRRRILALALVAYALLALALSLLRLDGASAWLADRGIGEPAPALVEVGYTQFPQVKNAGAGRADVGITYTVASDNLPAGSKVHSEVATTSGGVRTVIASADLPGDEAHSTARSAVLDISCAQRTKVSVTVTAPGARPATVQWWILSSSAPGPDRETSDRAVPGGTAAEATGRYPTCHFP